MQNQFLSGSRIAKNVLPEASQGPLSDLYSHVGLVVAACIKLAISPPGEGKIFFFKFKNPKFSFFLKNKN